MSMTAEKERKMEDDLTGVDKKPKSKTFWVDRFVMEFALMARKLRGKPGAKIVDDYSPIIDRQLAKVDAAIILLEKNPQMAQDYGENGKGIEEILDMIERKAAEIEADEIFGDAARVIRKNLPGARVNALVRKGQAGGLVPSNSPLVPQAP